MPTPPGSAHNATVNPDLVELIRRIYPQNNSEKVHFRHQAHNGAARDKGQLEALRQLRSKRRQAVLSSGATLGNNKLPASLDQAVASSKTLSVSQSPASASAERQQQRQSPAGSTMHKHVQQKQQTLQHAAGKAAIPAGRAASPSSRKVGQQHQLLSRSTDRSAAAAHPAKACSSSPAESRSFEQDYAAAGSAADRENTGSVVSKRLHNSRLLRQSLGTEASTPTTHAVNRGRSASPAAKGMVTPKTASPASRPGEVAMSGGSSAAAAAAARPQVKKVGEYDRPWRQNMKPATREVPSPSAGQLTAVVGDNSSSAAAAASPAATPAASAATAAFQVLIADSSADVQSPGGPHVPRSKKRTPEEQAALQVYIRKSQLEIAKRNAIEKQQAAAAANRRKAALTALAEKQREVSRQHQQQLQDGELVAWEPEHSWHGVLTETAESSTVDVEAVAAQKQQQQHGAACRHDLPTTPAGKASRSSSSKQVQPQAPGGSARATPTPQQNITRMQQQDLGQQKPGSYGGSGEKAVGHVTGGTAAAALRMNAVTAHISKAEEALRAASPGKAYLQDKQAMVAANVLAQRQYQERLCAAAATPSTAAAYPGQQLPQHSTAAVITADATDAGFGCSTAACASAAAGSTPVCSHVKHKRPKSSSRKAASRSVASMRRDLKAQDPLTRGLCSPMVAAAARAGAVAAARSHWHSVQHQGMFSPGKAAVTNSSSPQRHATPDRKSGMPAGAGSGHGSPAGSRAAGCSSPGVVGMPGRLHKVPTTALTQFWAQQSAADSSIAQQALIQQLVQQSNLLKHRIELICAQALQQQQQAPLLQVQEQQPGSLLLGNAAEDVDLDRHIFTQQHKQDSQMHLTLSGAQHPADQLRTLLDQQQQQLCDDQAEVHAVALHDNDGQQQATTWQQELKKQMQQSNTILVASAAALGVGDSASHQQKPQSADAQILMQGALPQEDTSSGNRGSSLVRLVLADAPQPDLTGVQQGDSQGGQCLPGDSRLVYGGDVQPLDLDAEFSSPERSSHQALQPAARSPGGPTAAHEALETDATTQHLPSTDIHRACESSLAVAAEVRPGGIEWEPSTGPSMSTLADGGATGSAVDGVTWFYSALGGEDLWEGSQGASEDRHGSASAAAAAAKAARAASEAAVRASGQLVGFSLASIRDTPQDECLSTGNPAARQCPEHDDGSEAGDAVAMFATPAVTAPGASGGSAAVRQRWAVWRQRYQQVAERQQGPDAGCSGDDQASPDDTCGAGSEGLRAAQWVRQPAWASAGAAGYRWDTTSLSASPSNSGTLSPDAGFTCEMLLQQHEEQDAAAALPRMDKIVTAPRQAGQDVQDLLPVQQSPAGAADALGQSLVASDATPRKGKGDPHSIINTFLRLHKQRMQHLQEQQRQLQELHQQQPHPAADAQRQQQQQQEVTWCPDYHTLQTPDGVQRLAASEPECTLQQQQDTPCSLSQHQQQLEGVPSVASVLQQEASAEAASLARSTAGSVGGGLGDGPQQPEARPIPAAKGGAAGDVPDPRCDPAEQQLLKVTQGVQVDWHGRRTDEAAPGPASPAALQAVLDQSQASCEKAAHQQDDLPVSQELATQQLVTLLRQHQLAVQQEQAHASALQVHSVAQNLLDTTFAHLKDVAAVLVKAHMQKHHTSSSAGGGAMTPRQCEGVPPAAAAAAGQQDPPAQELSASADVPAPAHHEADAGEDGRRCEAPGEQQQQSMSASGAEDLSLLCTPGLNDQWLSEAQSLPPEMQLGFSSGGGSRHSAHQQLVPVPHFQAMLQQQMAADQSGQGSAAADTDAVVTELSAAEASLEVGSEAEACGQHTKGTGSARGLSDPSQVSIGSSAAQGRATDSGSRVCAAVTERLGSEAFSHRSWSAGGEEVAEDSALLQQNDSNSTAQAHPGALGAALQESVTQGAALSSSSSQYHGSSATESEIGSRQQQHQLHVQQGWPVEAPEGGAEDCVEQLQQQLHTAEQQLSALSNHIDALMVGFAVQALQAAKDKARQQAIHTQALAEQQKNLAKKNKLQSHISSLRRQLGLSPNSLVDALPVPTPLSGATVNYGAVSALVAAVATAPELEHQLQQGGAVTTQGHVQLGASAATGQPAPTHHGASASTAEYSSEQSWCEGAVNVQQQQPALGWTAGFAGDASANTVTSHSASVKSSLAPSLADAVEARTVSIEPSRVAVGASSSQLQQLCASAEAVPWGAEASVLTDCSISYSPGALTTDASRQSIGDTGKGPQQRQQLQQQIQANVLVLPVADVPSQQQRQPTEQVQVAAVVALEGQDSMTQQQQEVLALQQLVAREQQRQHLQQQKHALEQQLQSMKQQAVALGSKDDQQVTAACASLVQAAAHAGAVSEVSPQATDAASAYSEDFIVESSSVVSMAAAGEDMMAEAMDIRGDGDAHNTAAASLFSAAPGQQARQEQQRCSSDEVASIAKTSRASSVVEEGSAQGSPSALVCSSSSIRQHDSSDQESVQLQQQQQQTARVSPCTDDTLHSSAVQKTLDLEASAGTTTSVPAAASSSLSISQLASELLDADQDIVINLQDAPSVPDMQQQQQQREMLEEGHDDTEDSSLLHDLQGTCVTSNLPVLPSAGLAHDVAAAATAVPHLVQHQEASAALSSEHERLTYTGDHDLVTSAGAAVAAAASAAACIEAQQSLLLQPTHSSVAASVADEVISAEASITSCQPYATAMPASAGDWQPLAAADLNHDVLQKGLMAAADMGGSVLPPTAAATQLEEPSTSYSMDFASGSVTTVAGLETGHGFDQHQDEEQHDVHSVHSAAAGSAADDVSCDGGEACRSAAAGDIKVSSRDTAAAAAANGGGDDHSSSVQPELQQMRQVEPARVDRLKPASIGLPYKHTPGVAGGSEGCQEVMMDSFAETADAAIHQMQQRPQLPGDGDIGGEVPQAVTCTDPPPRGTSCAGDGEKAACTSSKALLVDAIAAQKFNELLSEVLDEAVLLCSPVKPRLTQQCQPVMEQPPTRTRVEGGSPVESIDTHAAAPATASLAAGDSSTLPDVSHSASNSTNASSAPDSDGVRSGGSSGSQSLQPDWQSSVGELSPYASPLSMLQWPSSTIGDREARGGIAAAETATGSDARKHAKSRHRVQQDEQQQPTPQDPAVAPPVDVHGELDGAVRCLEPLLEGGGNEGEGHATTQVAAADERQPHIEAAAVGDKTDDDEFDYSAELEAAEATQHQLRPSSSSTGTGTAGADETWTPTAPTEKPPEVSFCQQPPPPVDDSSAHIQAYLAAVCDALLESLPDRTLPGRIEPMQELLSLELYLAVEKGNAEWLELPDESHIFHKALYDALNQAVQQLYAEAGRVLRAPGQPPLLQPRRLRPLPHSQDLLAAASSRVLSWARQRVRDDGGLERLLHEAALAEDKVWADVSVELSEVALLVAEGIWDDLLRDTADNILCLEQQKQQPPLPPQPAVLPGGEAAPAAVTVA